MKKTKILLFSAVALAVGFLTAASVQAVPITYTYTGNPFTFTLPPYTTSDFVSGMVTLEGPLAANMSLTTVTPTAFSISDGVQTITNLNPTLTFTDFAFATGPTGEITEWSVFLIASSNVEIATTTAQIPAVDRATSGASGDGANTDAPGIWSTAATTPDTGSTLSLMTLTLMALGVAARRLQRAAA